MARDRPERVRALVGLAAAPAFTEDLIWAKMTDAQRAELAENGKVLEPHESAPCEPYVISQKKLRPEAGRVWERGRDV